MLYLDLAKKRTQGRKTLGASGGTTFRETKIIDSSDMTIKEINKVNQTLGFFAMTVAWLLANFAFCIYQFLNYGNTTDTWALVFWTGVFMFTAWLIFITIPLSILDFSSRIFKPTIMPIITGVYGMIIYSILIGGIFQDLRLVLTFLPLAFFSGLIFGLTYSLFLKADKLLILLANRPIYKLPFILLPFVIMTLFYISYNYF